MKRLRVDESSKEGSGPPLAGTLYRPQQQQQQPTLAFPGAVKVLSEGMQSGLFSVAAAAAPQTVNYGSMPVAAAPHSGKPPQSMATMRTTGASPPSATLQESPQQQSPSSFQRLKVEDALSYLDQVKYSFGSRPQVYNDFLDIMKEFKSQSIDTPGVIQRVSNLFKGYPELIEGFNTFLPPGYKIEVQRSDQGGYAFSVQVSMHSPTGGTISSNQQKSATILSGSGRITMAGPPHQVVPPPPPPQAMPPAVPPPHQQQQPHVISSQVVPQAPPPPPPAATAAVLHHHSSTNYGGISAAAAPPTNYGLSLSAAQAAVNHALQGHTDTPQNQPVEFNHAINYVNKIKNRFQGQPEKYKRFLEILHTYQKEQRTIKESNVASNIKHLTEQEVYSQVAKLFENQSDLLAEFGQFLPDATSHINQAPVSDHSNSVNKKSLGKPYHHHHRDHLPDRHISHKSSHHQSGSVKRSPPYSNYHRDAPPLKKHKISAAYRDVSLSEAGKYGTLNDYAFFDKVRKALRSQEIYNNFLRCLILFNQEIISKSELLQIVTPFLGKFPELLKWFKEFMGQNESEPIPYNVTRSERPQGDHALEIDLATAKRLGASYCIIPKAQEGQKCSGRTQLCKEVLNDQWVSFPTWSEDSTFVSSRKTQYEEYMYRCEDERFELDVVIETNASTIRILESINKKMSRMTADELSKYKLDECLGGNSPTLHQRALRRIYGEKAPEIVEGLRKNPAVAVPIVLKRLRIKEEEWREAQKGFNKIWREQNEKYYLKSLDHMGINFKQTDVKAIRTKSLFNEIETIFDERHEQNDEGSSDPASGPHLIIPYRDKGILDDAANLLIHHVKRQTGIQKGEKRKIKHLLRQFLPDVFFHARQPLSDDEREDDDDNEDKETPSSSPKNGDKETKVKRDSPLPSTSAESENSTDVKMEIDVKDDDVKVPLHAQTSNPEEMYTLFMANNNWYIFLRLHAILCERLLKIYERAVAIAQEEKANGAHRKESTALALRLKPKPHIELEEYYPAFLDMVKNLLDGNMEANTYEDTLREMFGIHAYTAFTLDKVVSYAVRQLQHCVTERTALGCTELYLKEQKRCAAGGPCSTAHKRAHLEQTYQRAAEKVVQEENCFKIYIYKCDCKMTIELLDTEPEDSKKVEEANKWNSYKECYADITQSAHAKPRSPIYLNRNMRLYKQRVPFSGNKKCRTPDEEDGENKEEREPEKRPENEGDLNIFEALERKLNERAPERNQTDHPGYVIDDNQECKFNPHDSKVTFMLTKDCYLYKSSAFLKARQSHPKVTKGKAVKFRGWLKKWVGANVSDAQTKQCTDWLMGRCEGVVPNRTRIVNDNDLLRTPYVSYNRYRVDRIGGESQGG